MYEGKYGFGLVPECVITGEKVEIKQIRIPLRKRRFMEFLFGGRECWQVQVWEFAEGYATKRPTWCITLDPDCSCQEAEKKAAEVREMYREWKMGKEAPPFIRMAEPLVSLPPKRPVLVVGKELSAEERGMLREYEIKREERAARFKVLVTICPKTAELTEQAELSGDPETKRRLEEESLEAFFAENAPGWPALIFKAWQRLNPIGLSWMNWLYIWSSKRRKRPEEVNEVDYELAFNWMWKRYFLLTAEELKDAIYKSTNHVLSADAITKRRVRLGLTTLRPTGPKPRV